ncbi:glutathione ABC transporter substrate-binding protein [Sporosarcina ureilytica]|uniref:Glutathione ABC transporter substrate-binding protein n=1 Tax=Sporosarcina ureilytica TaxID=298596 RepID=A0A1D8JE01_9BACL|nr:glutathione ABC transporter substrate-binding protein [Sporosarcina ureilytica]AOV06921.1 glutathione ABC transporter substrate-binding protein [Sporosarcina ureilytica]
MKNSKKWLSILLLSFTMILAACAGGGNEAESNQQGEAQNGTEKDLVLAVHSDASTLDPAGSNDVPSHNIQQPIFEGLVKRDSENKIIPGLAKEWKVIDDLTYEFILQEDVEFHDGEAFNAEAVKINIERLLDPEVASSKYDYYAMISEVEVVDEYTVRIKTEYPFSPLLAHLSHSGGAMISPKAIEADYEAIKNGQKPGTAISENPVGTGHFKFESWTPGEEVKLVKNDDYWGEGALVDTVTFKIVPESGTRNADLERGFVHIVDPVQPNEVPQLNDSDFATVVQTPSTGLSFIGFNMSKAPFDDVNVRKAVSMIINKQEIIDGVYDGFGIAAEGPLAPKVFGYSEEIKGIDQNIEEAKKLMKEAGYEDGFNAALWTNDNPQRVDTAIILQNALKEINVELTIEQMEFGTYIEKLKSGEHDMYMMGWTNPLADADNGLYSLFHSSTEGIPPNAMWYGSSVVDDLLDKGREATDEKERLDLYKQAQEEIIADAPMLFLDYREYLTGVSNKITGFRIDSGGIYHLENVQFVE